MDTKRKIAFIDVQNTATTTQKLLGFVIDWKKLCNYLKDKWKCEKVFFYSGVDDGDFETAKEFESLAHEGCIIRTKTVFAYKRPDKKIPIKCINCGTENIEVVDMGYNRKSNCDVDLTVDAMEESGPDKKFIIFTGDGDFEYLIQKVLEKGTEVSLVSSNAGIKKPGINTKRLSTKLKELIKDGKIYFIDINSWKMKIKKDI
ncbi:MAG: NYN domain-containing protein [Candidatus Paceibacterota bacterium]|jgi:uncharacterized LabA/DUF88 family protein